MKGVQWTIHPLPSNTISNPHSQRCCNCDGQHLTAIPSLNTSPNHAHPEDPVIISRPEDYRGGIRPARLTSTPSLPSHPSAGARETRPPPAVIFPTGIRLMPIRGSPSVGGWVGSTLGRGCPSGHRRFFVHVGNTHPRDPTERRLQQRKEKKGKKKSQRRIRRPAWLFFFRGAGGASWTGMAQQPRQRYTASRPPFPPPPPPPSPLLFLCPGRGFGGCLPGRGVTELQAELSGTQESPIPTRRTRGLRSIIAVYWQGAWLEYLLTEAAGVASAVAMSRVLCLVARQGAGGERQGGRDSSGA